MDALSHLLAACELNGSFFSRARLNEPWAVSTRGAEQALFHVVVQGRGRLEVADAPEATVTFGPGDLLLLPHGSPHVIRGRLPAPPAPIRSLPAEPGPGLRTVCHGGEGEPTTLLCGTLGMSTDGGGHLLPHLPLVLHLRASDPAVAEWIHATLRLLEQETRSSRAGSEAMVRRIAEVLLVQALRAWVEGPDAPRSGWLAGLRDPQLARALAAVHEAPDQAWTAAELARRSGMSRTALFERFQTVVGESPADYLTRWRMVLACQRLRRPEARVSEVAHTVGYASEAAFSRAFKRHLGQAPTSWRDARGGAGERV